MLWMTTIDGLLQEAAELVREKGERVQSAADLEGEEVYLLQDSVYALRVEDVPSTDRSTKFCTKDNTRRRFLFTVDGRILLDGKRYLGGSASWRGDLGVKEEPLPPGE